MSNELQYCILCVHNLGVIFSWCNSAIYADTYSVALLLYGLVVRAQNTTPPQLSDIELSWEI